MKNIIGILAFTLIFYSCKREDQAIQTGNSKYSGVIQYTSSSFVYVKDSARIEQNILFYGNGYFCKTPNMFSGQWERIGDLMIGNYQVYDSLTTGQYAFSISQIIDTMNITQFGKKINFSISGGGDYSSAFATQYVPQIIFIYSKKETDDRHSKMDSLLITWNPDPYNQNIEISLNYDGITSHDNDSSLSESSYTTNPIIVPDNGKFILPPSFFAEFSQGSEVGITITRRGDGEMKSNDKWIQIATKSTSVIYRTIIN